MLCIAVIRRGMDDMKTQFAEGEWVCGVDSVRREKSGMLSEML